MQHATAALDTAEQEVAGGTAFDLEHDDDGARGWEVKVATEQGKQHDVTVSDDGSRVTGKRADTTPDDDVRKVKRVKVTAKVAAHKAAERHTGEDLAALEIDQNRQGTLLWQVSTVKRGSTASADPAETETLINALSGKVMGEKRDD